jgi:hypothetical protein
VSVEDAFYGQCPTCGQPFLEAKLAAANARIAELEVEMGAVMKPLVDAANARADAAEERRGQALRLCSERESMLKASESEAAALRAEVERLKVSVENFEDREDDTQKSLTEARALLRDIYHNYEAGRDVDQVLETYFAANPESPRAKCTCGDDYVAVMAAHHVECPLVAAVASPRAAIYHMVGSDARDGLPCTHECEHHRYGDSPRAAAAKPLARRAVKP